MIRLAREDDIVVRAILSGELPRTYDLAEQFHITANAPGAFDRDRFYGVWATFIAQDLGIFLVAENSTGEILGGLGGITCPDTTGDAVIASEMFWFIRPDSRGRGIGTGLLGAFEDWAKTKQANQIQMVSLTNGSSMGKFYERRGYDAIETRYSKVI